MQLQYANLGNNWKQSYTNSEDREAGRRVEAWIAAKGEVTVSPFQVACIHKLRWNVKVENHFTFGQGKDFEFLFWSVDIIHLQFGTSTVCLFSQCRLEVQCAPPLLRRFAQIEILQTEVESTQACHRFQFLSIWPTLCFYCCESSASQNSFVMKICLFNLSPNLALLVSNDSTGGVFNFEFVFFMIPK